MSYTADDFARAEFARHPDGRKAMRIDPSDTDGLTWFVDDAYVRNWRTDDWMALFGFVPVPAEAKPTITESTAAYLWRLAGEYDQAQWPALLERETGLNIVPDPEPSNAERISALYRNWISDSKSMSLGEYFEAHGVRAPEGGDEK